MDRLGRGESYLLTSADAWRIKTLQESGYLLEDITAEIAKYTKLQTNEIKSAMQDAGVKALAYDDAIYSAAGLSPVALAQSPELIRIMERNMLATMGEWKNYTATTANAAQRLYIEQCDLAYNKVMTGATSYAQAVKEAITKIAADGVTVTYPTGHKDTIETATARAVRTGIAQATGDISIKRMEEMEWDIILVSAHVGARTGDGGENPGNHFWWQGKYYSRSGNDKRFPPFSVTGYGSGEGLCGWNCRHSFGSGTGRPEDNPYKDISSEENRKVEELEKKQRRYERRIRKTKREVAGLQTSVENCPDKKLKFELQQELDRKSALLSKQNKAYNQFCRENDLKPLRERLQIAEWNREKAMKAAGAARRYERRNNE
nr:MAG TPA: minor capsid protein [Caudoviricetes sp.]